MYIFEWILVLLVGAVCLAAAARRIGAPYPTFLAVGGACIAFIPNMPTWELEPELTLALFVSPVLLDAAYDTSIRDLRRNWLPITSLVVVAVGLTTAAVALVARWLVPDMPLAAAVALGAIVSPPDAAAASAIIRQVGLPFRITQILEGESLLNDASALLIYRLAVGALVAGGFASRDIPYMFLVGVVGSLVAGPVLGYLVHRVVRTFEDAPSSIILQFCSTFGVWILAERLGLSGILTIVAYALTMARLAPMSTPARLRVPAYAVWETAVFMLNAFAFMLIGLQLRPILERTPRTELATDAGVAFAVLATVIVVRIVWVAVYRGSAHVAGIWLRPQDEPADRKSTLAGSVILSWTGMRGIISLAAAVALPETLADGRPMPMRDMIVLTCFVVVAGTLLLQGLTLRSLIGWLNLSDDDPVGREVVLARLEGYRAALSAIDGDDSLEAKLLRREYRELVDRTEASREVSFSLPADPLRRRAIAAARRRAHELRLENRIGDDAYHLLEEEFDLAELSAEGDRP